MTPEIIISLIGISLITCLIAFAIWLEYKDRKEPSSPTVTCEDCKYEVKLENAYKVKYVLGHMYYCQSCKPNYSRIELGYDIVCYYKELEVTKDGEPVGYKKK